MNSLFKKAISGAAALGVAVAGLALGASSAYAADTDPTKGTITITDAKTTHNFSGWRLAKLTDITKDDGGTINGFQIDTINNRVTDIENAMKAVKLDDNGAISATGTKTLYTGYAADKNYFTAENSADNNPMGYLADVAFKDGNGTSMSETVDPWGGDSSTLRAFAQALSAQITANADKTFTADANNTPNNNVPQGLWLLKDTTATSDDTAKEETNSIPIITPTSFVGKTGWGTIAIKNTTPTIDKKLVDQQTDGTYKDNTKPDYAVGDTVTYELTSKIPTFTGYDIDPTLSTTSRKTRVFQIIDTADKSLTVADPVTSTDPVVSVKVGTTELKYDKDYTVSVKDYAGTDTKYTNGHVTTIDLAKYVNKFGSDTVDTSDDVTSVAKGIDEGATVTVIFQAKLNANAKISDSNSTDPLENWNRDDLRYSNKPDSVSDAHKVPGKEVPVYAYKFSIHKTDKAGTKLPGAQFVIKAGADTSNNGQYLGTYTNTATDKSGWKYEKTKPTACTAAQITNNTCTTAGVFVSDSNGNIAVEGLDSGTYEVEEIAPPAGYTTANPLKFTFTIEATADTTNVDGHKTIERVALNLPQNVDERVTKDATDGKTLNIWNAKNITELPKTGGAGLVLIIAAGAMFIAAGGLFALRARRKA
ncbi:putative LPXTG-motif protein cell wall anchor domain protein [Bifidobacterium saguini DSM 23967]|uniref:Isopeptide-forming domain-containing fimbrial protein n=2 Tax=Bifidobacterium saguini TaxID=762210 RepID=A0ABX7SFD6_9BIFI|nr:SpaA isopeptide-forming pilin-related protein [Bifidobacterium saguini]KFI92879.1 putative LPXTG-motif protein cell wall anchor domain protein [Bifidobacterium saguini DSM 23967]QTB91868.1 isopeptide-forming domain-containing fimbrial protein [Bifidobacterium saguini]